jgi:hypothetical protein
MAGHCPRDPDVVFQDLTPERKARMRRALTPRSLRPTREAERTSMRLPFGAGLTRTTISSVKPNQRVVSLA